MSQERIAAAEPSEFLKTHYFDVPQLAQICGHNQRWVWRRIAEGEPGSLPPITKIGRKTLFKITSVMRWLDSLEQNPAAEQPRKRA